MTKIAFDKTSVYKKLQDHFQETSSLKMKELFRQSPDRYARFSIRFEDILFDYSKNRITEETLALLLELCTECGLQEAVENMFSGKKINISENRPVLHTALRSPENTSLWVDNTDVIKEVHNELDHMRDFSERFISGEKFGFTGKPLRTVIHIGIGGSDLGPVMITEALKPYKNHLDVLFVSNVDGTHITEALKNANPETTFFLVASKTFTTQETMLNAQTARDWLLDSGAGEKDIALHFGAISANIDAVKAFGISEENIFTFWDWVGGRYSLWSAIGLSICLSVGFDHFEELLKGAHAMDNHFRYTPFGQNIPVIMALLGIWYNNFFKSQTYAILPYDQYMHRFAAYLQQCDMESNGKSVSSQGEPVCYPTGPVIWGEPGTNGQHAFFQLLHQGTHLVPCDFIAPAQSHNSAGTHHKVLLSNFFAQTEALMKGRTEEEIIKAMKDKGYDNEAIESVLPFKICPGNKPSNTILLKKITPYSLGSLIAMYEHKVFVQGIIWNIFSFDQWGVELGKDLASNILPELQNTSHPTTKHDSSTNGLINQYKRWANQ